MEESGSEGLDELIESEVGPGKFFEGVDCVCISDNYWLNDRTVRLLLLVLARIWINNTQITTAVHYLRFGKFNTSFGVLISSIVPQRGITYYKVTVSGPGRDLHSGVFGNMVHEVGGLV